MTNITRGRTALALEKSSLSPHDRRCCSISCALLYDTVDMVSAMGKLPKEHADGQDLEGSLGQHPHMSYTVKR